MRIDRNKPISFWFHYIFMVIVGLLSGSTDRARAENWPQWRGPRGDGVSAEKNVPTAWSPDQNVLWKSEIPGIGHSSPIVWEESVFLTTAINKGHDRQLLRIDARNGKILWQRNVVHTDVIEHIHDQNSYASSTPATDGEKIFTSFCGEGKVVLSALDFDGNPVWELRPGDFNGEHGYCYSPMVYKDLVIISLNHEIDPALYAINRNTGKIVWKTPYEGKVPSYTTPIVVTSGGREQLLVSGSDLTQGIDPATGRQIWGAPGPTDYVVADVVYGGDLVFTNGGYPDRIAMAFKTNGGGELVWSSKKGVAYVPSPIYFDHHVYSVIDGGIAHCFGSRTGDILWQRRIPGNYRSSLLLTGDGNLYSTNDEATTTVFRATAEGYQEIATNKLDDFCYASPAVSNGRVYVRTKSSLYCIGK